MREFNIRRANIKDVNQINEIMRKVYFALEDKAAFAPDDTDTVMMFLEPDNFILVAEAEDGLAAFLAVEIPGEAEDNLGHDIGLKQEELHKVAHIESTAVLPEYRGNGLQMKLMTEAEKLLSEMEIEYYMATVYPGNRYSLNNFLTLDYKIIRSALKYGGLDRLVLLKSKLAFTSIK